MAPIVHTRPTKATTRLPMDPARNTALAGGVFYLITFVASIPALLLIAPVLDHADYIVGSGADTRVLWGCLLDLVTALACIGSAVALFPVVRRQHEGFAVGFVTARVFEAAVIVIGVGESACGRGVAAGRRYLADATSLITVGGSLVAVRNATFLLGPGVMPGVNAVLLGYLMYRSGLVPRVIPVMGLLGAPLFLTAAITSILGVNEQMSVWSALAKAPIFLWELSLGVYLVVKGFKQSVVPGE